MPRTGEIELTTAGTEEHREKLHSYILVSSHAGTRKRRAGAIHHIQSRWAGALFHGSGELRGSDGGTAVRAHQWLAAVRAGRRKQSGGHGLGMARFSAEDCDPRD